MLRMQAADLKGSIDYFALNHYTSTCVSIYSPPLEAPPLLSASASLCLHGQNQDCKLTCNVHATCGCRYVIGQQGAVGLQGPCDYVETQVTPDGHLIGAEADSDWLKVTPWGFRLMLNWVNNRCTHRTPANVVPLHLRASLLHVICKLYISQIDLQNPSCGKR